LIPSGLGTRGTRAKREWILVLISERVSGWNVSAAVASSMVEFKGRNKWSFFVLVVVVVLVEVVVVLDPCMEFGVGVGVDFWSMVSLAFFRDRLAEADEGLL
jgi:hypothetical protein